MTRNTIETSKGLMRETPGEHCPGCGERTLWCEVGEGDFYLGPTSICVDPSCAWSGSISGGEDRPLSKELAGLLLLNKTKDEE